MEKFFNLLFEQGNIWGILVLITVFAGVTILQGRHEKGVHWARTGQYIIGILFIIYMVIMFTKL